MTPMNSILELPIKSANSSQRSSSTSNSNNNTSLIGTDLKSSSDDPYVKKQKGGFENTLKEKINVDNDAQCKENESDESEDTTETDRDVRQVSEQVANVVEPPCEQMAIQAPITEVVDLLNENMQTLAQQQNAVSSSDNVIVPETQVISNTQTLPPQTEQGASDLENEQPDPIGESSQDEVSQADIDNAELLKNGQLTSKDETLQNKSSDIASQTNAQAAAINTKVDDSLIKNALEANSPSPQLNENLKSQEESQAVISDALKQAENLSQSKTTESINDKADKIKSLENSQDKAFQNNAGENQPSLVNEAQSLSNSTESLSASDNNIFEIKSDNVAELNAPAKVEVHQPISIETDISTNSQQAESIKDVSQAQNIENLSQSVAKQMQNSVNLALNRNQDQITVNLSPPELGRVTIKFIENQNQITGVLQVEKPQVRADIENALPQIIRNLEASGIQVKRIDVEVYDQNNINQQASKDHGFQGNFSAQQDSGQNQNNSNHAGNAGFESNKAQIFSAENADNYQLNSILGSESINLFA